MLLASTSPIEPTDVASDDWLPDLTGHAELCDLDELKLASPGLEDLSIGDKKIRSMMSKELVPFFGSRGWCLRAPGS